MNQVGRYQIAEELGRGAMGVVYKALDPAIGRTVAIKTIHLTDLPDSEARQRFGEQLLREAQSAGTLSHPNIVTIFDVLKQDDFACIVMEYLPGASLAEMLQQGRQPATDELILLLGQVAEALDYANRKGIVHRDIKPANIIISDAGSGSAAVAKITDFGVARALTSEVTQDGGLSGTPSYMSPEQIAGLAIDGRSDQFSVAVVAYQLLSGRKPFEADTLPALLHLISASDPPPINQVNPALSATVEKVMRRALAKNPKERFPSVSDFVGALSIALAESPARDESSAASPEPMAAEPPVLLTAFSSPSPGLVTRHRRGSEADDTTDSAPVPHRIRKRLALIVLLCFIVAAAIMFIVRMNSGPQVPVQVLETQSAPASAPPVVERSGNGNRATQPSAGGNSAAAQGHTSPEASRTNPSPPPNADVTAPQPPASTPPNALTAKQPAARSSESTGTNEDAYHGTRVADVDLLSNPPGAKIDVDDRQDAVCNAPCTMALPVGRHTLTAELHGYELARKIFNVPETTSLYITLTQSSGVLVLNSTPSGLTVAVDGKTYGHTPATLHLTAGLHRITVFNGSQQREETVNIEPETFQARSIRW